MTRTVVNLLLVTLLLLTLLRTLVLAHGNLHEHERQLDHGIDANLEDEPRTQTNLSFLKLFESTNSRPMCRQKGECIKLGGSCQEKGSCPHTHIESRGCAPECSCCLPISTTEECAQENGFCVETGDSCNGTIKILDTSCEDYCTCCLPVPTPDQCSEKNGFCVENGDRCNGRIKILHNSWEDHCTCCLPVSTIEKCADKNGFCLETGDRCNGAIKNLDTSCEEHYTCCLPVPTPDQCSEINGFCLENGDRCNGTINIVHNTMEDHCSCCVPETTTSEAPTVAAVTTEVHAPTLSGEGPSKVNLLTVGGTAKATSEYPNGNHNAVRGFDRPGYAWCSAQAMPQSIWYEFPQALRVVKYSFRSRTDTTEPDTSPSTYVFWGSNNIECSKSEARVTLVEDTSGTPPFTNENIPKVVDVENPLSYRCYGFTITKTQGTIRPYTCVSEISLFYDKD